MTIILIITALLICLIEGVPLIRKGMWKEFTTISFLLFIALFIQIGVKLGMPTPIDLIEKLFMPIGKMFLKRL
ncbi:MAG: hypothetical protein WCQ54_11300 [Clostridiaceae bacterium]